MAELTGHDTKLDQKLDQNVGSHPDDGAKESAWNCFLDAYFYSGIQAPCSGLSQFADHLRGKRYRQSPESFQPPKDNNAWTKIGSMAGVVTELTAITMVADLATQWSGLGDALLNLDPMFNVGVRGASLGVMFGLANPVPEDNNYWLNKRKVVAQMSATMGVMYGVGVPLGRLMGHSLVADVASGGLSGIAGGITNTALQDVFYHQRPTLSQASNVLTWGAIGAGMGLIGHSWYDNAALVEKTSGPKKYLSADYNDEFEDAPSTPQSSKPGNYLVHGFEGGRASEFTPEQFLEPYNRPYSARIFKPGYYYDTDFCDSQEWHVPSMSFGGD